MAPTELIPRFHQKLFKWLCKDELYHELAGDLEETFAENYLAFGKKKARSIYKKEVFKLLRPSVIRTFNQSPYISFIMFKNYFKISLVNIWRDKENSFVSLFGLASAILASVLIFQYVNYELSYDEFQDQTDGNIYRVPRLVVDIESQEIKNKSAGTFHAAHPAVSLEIPEVIYSTHFFPTNGVFTKEGQGFNAEDIFYTTSSFFDVFSFQLLSGDKSELDQPGTVFLSESYAKKVFGDTNPLGQSLRYNDNTYGYSIEMQVKGVFQDFPSNSHLYTSVMLPMANLNSHAEQNMFGSMTLSDISWRWLGFHTYIKSRKDVSRTLLQEKLGKLITKYRQGFDKDNGRVQKTEAQALADIHFITDFTQQLKPAGNRSMLSLFKLIGILIIVMGWINFVNLASAKSVRRAKEVGVRKAMGALKKQLVSLFLIESLLVNLIALIIATGLIFLVIPGFHELIGAPAFDYFRDFIPFWSLYLALFFTGAIFSGLYPAFVLTRFNPILVLRGNFKHSAKGIWLRKSLMFTQFAVVIIMLSGVLVIRSQIQYMLDYDIGMNRNQTVIIDTPPPFLQDSTFSDRMQAFQGDIENLAAITSSCISSIVPGVRSTSGTTVSRTDRPANESIHIRNAAIDPRFISFYGMEIISGRDFSQDLVSDQNILIINETALTELDFQSAEEALEIGLRYPNSDPIKIVGVVKDFNYGGMKLAIEPMALHLNDQGNAPFISVRLNTGNLQQTMQDIEGSYSNFFPGAVFESWFLDDTFNQLYESDQKFHSVIKFFTLVAILISCLGIFGLSSFLINQKLKEVSIRKVLGAGVLEILRVLTREYYGLLLISMLIAIPVGYLLINQWLDGFLVRVALQPLMFIIPVLGLVSILCFTIGGKTWKAIRVNPARTLKAE